MKKVIIPAIAMISVLAMFIWGYIEGTWEHCWLAVFAGGIAIVICSMVMKNSKKDQEETKED